jgi:hypothetical protein
MHVLETYLRRLHEIRSTERGTPELSYRAALENLLNAVGNELDPAVQATAELADTGAGRPDFGLFDSRSGDLRGAVEVKPVAEDTPQTADGRQVARYWKHYGCVLVTNYRDFLLVVKEPNEKAPHVEGRYQLAANEETFWRSNPHTLAKQHGEGLLDFLASVMIRTAPIVRAVDLAADLARHARDPSRPVFLMCRPNDPVKYMMNDLSRRRRQLLRLVRKIHVQPLIRYLRKRLELACQQMEGMAVGLIVRKQLHFELVVA